MQTNNLYLKFQRNPHPKASSLPAPEKSYVKACAELRDRIQKEKVRHQQREILSLSGGIALAVLFALFAGWQWQQANFQKNSNKMNARTFKLKNLFSSGLDIDALGEALKLGKAKDLTSSTKMNVRAALQQVVFGVHEQNRLEGHRNWVTEVSFSPNGKWIASTSIDDKIKLWSLDGREVRTLTHLSTKARFDDKDSDDKDREIQFSRNSMIIASATNKDVKLWRLDDHRLEYTLPIKNVTSLDFHPDPGRETLATIDESGSIQLWTTDGRKLQPPLQGPNHAVSVRFLKGDILAATSADGIVKFLTIDGRKLQPPLQGPNNIISTSFSPKNEVFAAASREGIVQLWNLSGEKLGTIRGSEGFLSVAFSQDGKQIVTGSNRGSIQLWDLDGKPIRPVRNII